MYRVSHRAVIVGFVVEGMVCVGVGGVVFLYSPSLGNHRWYLL